MLKIELHDDASQTLPVSVIQNKLSSRRTRQCGAYANAQVAEEAEHVSAPSARHGRRAERIFQNQVPANNPGDEFAKGGIAVRVCRSCHGNH